MAVWWILYGKAKALGRDVMICIYSEVGNNDTPPLDDDDDVDAM
jgi:hypothetical protein